MGDTSEDEFTSNDVVESNNEDDSGEVLMLMHSDGKNNAPDCEEEELVNRKLYHLSQAATEGIKNILSMYPESLPIHSRMSDHQQLLSLIGLSSLQIIICISKG